MSNDALRPVPFLFPSTNASDEAIRSPALTCNLGFFTGKMSQMHVPPVAFVSCLLISFHAPLANSALGRPPGFPSEAFPGYYQASASSPRREPDWF